MESLLQIGLIATEAALGRLVGGVQAGAGQADEAELLGRVRWLLCRPEDGDALSLLAAADTVIVGAVIRGDRDVTALAGTVRTLQRAGQKILAVAVWGRRAHALAEQLNCPGLLLPDPDDADQPPDAALRELICAAVREAQASAASAPAASAFAAAQLISSAVAAHPRTLKPQPDHQPSGDLCCLHPPATAFAAFSPTRVEAASGAAAIAAEPATEEITNTIQKQSPVAESACAVVARSTELPVEAAPNEVVDNCDAGEVQVSIPADTREFVITGEAAFNEAEDLRHDLTKVQAVTKQQVAELTAEKQRLADRLASADAARAAAEEEVRELRTEVMRLTSQLSTAEQQQRRSLPDDTVQAAPPGADWHVTQQQILRLEEQLLAAQECARFAEARTEDFFQRFASERRRAADLARELTAAKNEIASLSSQTEALTAERDHSPAEPARQATEHEAAFHRLQRQFRALESIRDEIAAERDALRDELATGRLRLGSLENEAQRLAEENQRLAQDLQATTAHHLEPDAGLAETLGTTAPMARQVGFAASHAEAEDLDFEAMAGADLALIVRLDATVQQLIGSGDSMVDESALPRPATEAGLSYDTLLHISQELHKTVKSVIEFIERLMSREEHAPEQQSRWLVMRRVIHELLHTIGNIADYAQLKSAPSAVMSRPVNLTEMTSDLIGVIEPLIADRRLSVSVNLPPDAQHLSTDPHRLRQILSELLVNAAKFTPSGRISLEARMMDGQAIIAVTDTGIGLDQSDLTRIFEPFARLGRKPGTGLGLTVARQLAESIGGRIEVRSRPGKGAIFGLIIPYIPVATVMPEAPAPKSDGPNQDGPVAGEGFLAVR